MMMPHEMLRPVVALVAWTLVMLGWMLATRLPALKNAGVELRTLVGTKASDADRVIPPHVQWKAHNYNHLLEQPVLFYAICGVLALTLTFRAIDLYLAWIYVALRIAHSLVQVTRNKVVPRLMLFLASSLTLAALTVRAALAVL
ncbi:hypothetical protein SAMN05216382_0759 [Sphingomonas palmae]|uniref:MAPEG family protein n=2 Tax=Sphingomonas palmae TaxID=1855283 RepID=A0A1H7IHS9_9SPHN|nr:hypothetical protein SAMN05216382_0759 [Sphingomonas palmae]